MNPNLQPELPSAATLSTGATERHIQIARSTGIGIQNRTLTKHHRSVTFVLNRRIQQSPATSRRWHRHCNV
jgi:hypothetical protein